MKTLIISYSMTGNNEALAAKLAEALGADRAVIKEVKERKIITTAMDMLLGRAPKIEMDPIAHIGSYDLTVFCGPVWMGQVASPLRGPIKRYRDELGAYAFCSISGGADGPNPKLADELTKRLGKAPVAVVDQHIRTLLPADPPPTRDDTSAYRVTDEDVAKLAGNAAAALRQALAGSH